MYERLRTVIERLEMAIERLRMTYERVDELMSETSLVT